MIWYNDEERKKALQSFSMFVTVKERHVFDRKTGHWNCIECDGSGRVLHPDALCDPAEGYKMAEHVNCQECRGTGMGTEKLWRKFYLEQKRSYAAQRKKETNRARLRKSAIAKLTAEELAALGVSVG